MGLRHRKKFGDPKHQIDRPLRCYVLVQPLSFCKNSMDAQFIQVIFLRFRKHGEWQCAVFLVVCSFFFRQLVNVSNAILVSLCMYLGEVSHNSCELDSVVGCDVDDMLFGGKLKVDQGRRYGEAKKKS